MGARAERQLTPVPPPGRAAIRRTTVGRDAAETPLLDALGRCVRKLMAVQVEREGINVPAWPETVEGNRVLFAFQGEGPRITIHERAVDDSLAATLTRFGAYADAFTRLATTPAAARVAAEFRQLVRDTGRNLFGREAEPTGFDAHLAEVCDRAGARVPESPGLDLGRG